MLCRDLMIVIPFHHKQPQPYTSLQFKLQQLRPLVANPSSFQTAQKEDHASKMNWFEVKGPGNSSATVRTARKQEQTIVQVAHLTCSRTTQLRWQILNFIALRCIIPLDPETFVTSRFAMILVAGFLAVDGDVTDVVLFGGWMGGAGGWERVREGVERGGVGCEGGKVSIVFSVGWSV